MLSFIEQQSSGARHALGSPLVNAVLFELTWGGSHHAVRTRMRKILALISTLGGLAACGGDSVTPPAPMSDLVIASDAELMSGAEDQPFTSTLMATGGSGSGYRWSVIDGALPTNVFLTSS
ncbi:MAG: hypothetical protein AAFV29_10535, partial [Myxococcota bacterium]